jgi:hypothetical protein
MFFCTTSSTSGFTNGASGMHEDALLSRFADDFVVGFERQDDAEELLRALGERLTRFGLELHPEKTRRIEFGCLPMHRRARRGERRPSTFAFLGFTHYCAWP